MSRVPLHDHTNNYQGGKLEGSAITGVGVISTSTTTGGVLGLPINATDVLVADAGGWFAGTTTETALAELAAKAIGYEAHGNMGATETFDARTGWHSGTFNANCTLTLTGAPTGTVSSLFLELAQDGTGGWTITLPASVVNKAAIEAAQVTTLSTTSFLVLLSRDGGTTWYGGWWGGSVVGDLDDLTDVTITTPAENDTLRYISGEWVNDNRRWEPVSANLGSGPEYIFDGDDPVNEWKEY